ncbi:MAG: RNA polymerase factor sigma-54 [Peptostreptococcaceae bacterium]|nr:RNA polymerase factor sigma-54 [Peptostreptococcaceae bacterium]
MKLNYNLTVEQKQQLSMTPELIQAIKILQFNYHELSSYIEEELTANPVLEKQPVTSDDENYEDNKQKEIPDEIKEKIIEGQYDDISYKQYNSDKKEFTLEEFATADITLFDELNTQLSYLNINQEENLIGRYIIEGIDKNGYLTVSSEEVSNKLNVELEEVEKILKLIQSFDPSGVGARNLSECLLIQLKQCCLSNDYAIDIVTNHLEDLANNKLSNISKETGATIEEIQDITDLIKTLEPKPGRAYSSGDATRYIVPEIRVEEVDGEYIVTLLDDSVPKLMVSSYYRKVSKQVGKDSEVSTYLNDRYNSAMWLIKSIEQRKGTILSVAKTIVDYQKGFFDEGTKYLKTMTLKEVAVKVGVHESTVSRAINGKYMQSPRGCFELKYFFTSGVYSNDGKISSNSIKYFIKEFIEKEDVKKPLSDQKIVDLLNEKGIDIKRRTVAKYREELNILSSSKRRRY